MVAHIAILLSVMSSMVTMVSLTRVSGDKNGALVHALMLENLLHFNMTMCSFVVLVYLVSKTAVVVGFCLNLMCELSKEKKVDEEKSESRRKDEEETEPNGVETTETGSKEERSDSVAPSLSDDDRSIATTAATSSSC